MSLIKSLGLALGGGLALGVGYRMGQTAAALPIGDSPDVPNLEPILDRLEKMETTVADVECALRTASPKALSRTPELEQRIRSQNSELEVLRAYVLEMDRSQTARIDTLSFSVSSLEDRIPALVEQSATTISLALRERLQREMQETASQTLELFADRIQVRVVEKIAAIESDLARQSEAINELRDYSLRTDRSMQRLIANIERLTERISSRLDVPAGPARTVSSERLGFSPAASELPVDGPHDLPGPARPKATTFGIAAPQFEEVPAHRRGNGFRVAAMVGGGLALTALVTGAIEFSGMLHTESTHAASSSPVSVGSLDTGALKAQLDLFNQAHAFAARKEYAREEDVCRSILKSDPDNVQAKHLLASALFHQEKLEESAQVLNSLHNDK